jgi:hypothetical protein
LIANSDAASQGTAQHAGLLVCIVADKKRRYFIRLSRLPGNWSGAGDPQGKTC